MIIPIFYFYHFITQFFFKITGADIFSTPVTGSSLIDGYVGGDLPNSYNWCIGNRVPYLTHVTQSFSNSLVGCHFKRSEKSYQGHKISRFARNDKRIEMGG